ncbi:MAG: hypothetical protein IJ379_11410 [Lachnospiraceae bacterium]|nr:hypothetical protein [Lachnospiraceae bacterium]
MNNDFNAELECPTAETKARLTRDLNLKEADAFMQDWEYEISNVAQLEDYVNYYRDNELNANEKSTLMRIILDAYNFYVYEVEAQEDIYKETIRGFLIKDYSVQKPNIIYWACGEEDLEDCFYISPLIREIRDKMTLNEEFMIVLSAELKRSPNDLDKPYEYLCEFRDRGMDKDSMYENLEKLRMSCDSEAEEDTVLDLMDFVSGWCSPHCSIF